MGKNSPLIYIRAPNLDYEPDKAIQLGHIWKDPRDPGSFCGPPLPIPREMEANHTFKAPWAIGKGKESRGSVGIWASFLQAIGVTAEANFSWDNANDMSHTFRRLDTYSIEPTEAYFRASIEAVASEAVKKRERLYMVTGVKVARGAVGSIFSSRSVGAGARFGFGGEAFGTPFDAGPDFNMFRSEYDSESYGESSDFVFAYRIRPILYPKGGYKSAEYGGIVVHGGVPVGIGVGAEGKTMAEYGVDVDRSELRLGDSDIGIDDLGYRNEIVHFVDEDGQECVFLI
ncbi:hypothetical protein FSARC_12245 [Fusarium sarcochroum]|uniref:Uncharacterized protein n=1 Tax=Fusarium sarcochroum TaxID=1208366 RepID=A0A8H4WX55_9HYPO|nr:hypothetical protein FSARC_12245 [Fusarium sarcochroum]